MKQKQTNKQQQKSFKTETTVWNFYWRFDLKVVTILQFYEVVIIERSARFCSVQFSSSWYLQTRESPYALHLVSQKSSQCCLRNSSSVGLIDDGSFSFFQGSWSGAPSFYAVPAGSSSLGVNVLVSISVFTALSTVFHSINSPDNSPLSHHSVLPVLFLPYWSFQLSISLWKSPSALM